MLDGIIRYLGCTCLEDSSTDEIDHTMRHDDRREFSVEGSVDLKALTTKCSVVHVLESNYNVMPFSDASEWPLHCSYTKRFYSDEKDPEHELSNTTVEYD